MANPPMTMQQYQAQILSAQQAQKNAAAMAPTTSGLAVALNGASGYLNGQKEAAANTAMQAATPTGIGSDAVASVQGGASDPGMVSNFLNAMGVSPSTASAAIGKKSDRRLKTDVARIGTLPNGLGVYTYRLEGGPIETGLMADEVAQVHPDATWFDPDDGFARVNYAKAVL